MHLGKLLHVCDLFLATSLVRDETDGDQGVTMTLYQDRRFQGTEKVRRNVYRYLRLRHAQSKRLSRFIECGQGAWMQEHSESHRLRVVCRTCRDRLCPACQRQRQLQVRKRLEERISEAWNDRWRMLTLTQKHSDAPLGVQVKNLLRAFRRLRQRSLWKRNVDSGYAFIEVTFNDEQQQWHPHLHALINGHFVPQAELAAHWSECSRGSNIVDIRKVRTKAGALKYLTKYVTKTANHDITSWLPRLAEYDQAMKGVRLVSAIGAALGLRSLERPESEEGLWMTLGQYDQLHDSAARGNHVAQRIIERWEQQGQLEADDPSFEFP